MNPIALPPPRSLFHDFLLQPTEPPFAKLPFFTEETPDIANDFLVQNRRPDLVCLKTADQALWALDLP